MSPLLRSLRSPLAPAVAVLVLAVVLTTAGCSDPTPGASASAHASPSSSAVVATVNGSPVRAADVELVRAERRLLGQDDGFASALKEAVERNLMHREAERLGLKPASASVDSRLAEIQSRYGGAGALDSALSGAGSSREQLRRSVTDGVLREALRDAKFAQVNATPDEVAGYYRRNRKRLFTTRAALHLGAIEVRTRMVAENAIERLRQGNPFAEVARQFSIDPQSRDAGGDLGWVLASSLPPGAQQSVATAGTGVIRRPVQGQGVWYVFDVIARRPAHVAAFADVRGRIRTQLTDVARSKALQDWLAEARKRAVITEP